MATRIDQAMLDIKNIRPPKFTIDDLDSELCAMSMIRALPAEYATLRSTLLLHDKLDKDIIREAFQTEEINRRSDPASLAALAANSTCFFCSKPGHLQVDCGLYKSAKAQASSSQSSGSKKQWRGARKAKEGTVSSTAGANITESAGNASLCSCDPSDPLCPLVHDAHCDWTADTGATAHMTPHRHWLRDYKPHRVPIKLADRTVVYSVGIGSVVFVPVVNGRKTRTMQFSNVLHVPDLQNNLLAVLYLTRKCGYHCGSH